MPQQPQQAPPGGQPPPQQAPPGSAAAAAAGAAAGAAAAAAGVGGRDDITEAVGRLDDVTRHLRAECPWDREQDERTIVPHTVEEAYELADAANRGDDAKLLDELGDVLFQVHFLSLLMEERGAGDLAQVAEHCRQKLIRRHPHVYGEVEAETAGEVLPELGPDQAGRAGPRGRGSSARCPRTCRGRSTPAR